MAKRRTNPLLSILSRVRITPAGCWSFTGATGRGGYGVIRTAGKNHYVHRFVYEHFVGPIPAELQIDHLCRVRNCVRLSHLEVVTPRVNTLRGDTFQAANAAKTHCLRGHEFSG